MPTAPPPTERIDMDGLRATVEHLAAIDRPSASPGEREAAEWIADRLRAEGCSDVRIDEEDAHGTYWWPLGLAAAIAGVAGFSRNRTVRLAAGAFGAAAIADDISGGRQWFRRRFLPKRSTWNVHGRVGDPNAPHTVIIVAHHDAAHWSLLFHPGVAPWFAEKFPEQHANADTTPPLMFPVVGGPLLTALGAVTGSKILRRVGAGLSLATAATMVEIGSRSTVPGANDNLTGVALLLALAQSLRENPAPGVQVVLLSTGSEESFMEGMQAFGRRHFGHFPTDSTHVICVDTLGSGELSMCEGEGMLFMRDYPMDFKDLVSDAAASEGVHIARGIKFRNATDGLIALRAGYPTVMIGSMNEFRVPSNYHWPTDTAENVDYACVAAATVACDATVRALADGRRSG